VKYDDKADKRLSAFGRNKKESDALEEVDLASVQQLIVKY
jgi:hypothetical protein